jgi:hypothetical protein
MWNSGTLERDWIRDAKRSEALSSQLLGSLDPIARFEPFCGPTSVIHSLVQDLCSNFPEFHIQMATSDKL